MAKDVITLRLLRDEKRSLSWIIWINTKCHHQDPYERGRWSLQTHRKNDVKWRSHKPRNANTTRSWERQGTVSPRGARGTSALPTSGLQTIMAVSENKYANILGFNRVMFSWLLVYGVSNWLLCDYTGSTCSFSDSNKINMLFALIHSFNITSCNTNYFWESKGIMNFPMPHYLCFLNSFNLFFLKFIK